MKKKSQRWQCHHGICCSGIFVSILHPEYAKGVLLKSSGAPCTYGFEACSLVLATSLDTIDYLLTGELS